MSILLLPVHTTCTAHFMLLDLIYSNCAWRRVKLCCFSLCSFLRPSITPSLCGLNILLSTLFSNTLSLCSCLIVRDQVLHPFRTTDKKYNLVYSNFYVFRQKTSRQKVLNRMVASITRIRSLLNFLQIQISICCSRSKILELLHIFEGFANNLCAMNLPCILLTRQ
jgi:hypothetical protein